MAQTRLINFTPGEARALLHRLSAPYLVATLLRPRDPFVVLDIPGSEGRELERLALCDAIEGSTFHKSPEFAHSPQAYSGAVRCLYRARAKIAAAFDLDPESIPFPQA